MWGALLSSDVSTAPLSIIVRVCQSLWWILIYPAHFDLKCQENPIMFVAESWTHLQFMYSVYVEFGWGWTLDRCVMGICLSLRWCIWSWRMPPSASSTTASGTRTTLRVTRSVWSSCWCRWPVCRSWRTTPSRRWRSELHAERFKRGHELPLFCTVLWGPLIMLSRFLCIKKSLILKQ